MLVLTGGLKNIFDFSFVSLEKKHFYHIFGGNGQKTPDFFETKFFFENVIRIQRKKDFAKREFTLHSVQTLVFRKIKLRIAGIDRGVKNIFDFYIRSLEKKSFLPLFLLEKVQKTPDFFETKKKFRKSSSELKEKWILQKGSSLCMCPNISIHKNKT